MYSTQYASPYYSSAYQYQASPSPQYYTTYEASPGRSSKHKRRATADGTYGQASPYASYYYAVPEETKPKRSSSHRHREHVSRHDRHKSHGKHQTYAYATDASGQYQYRSGDAYYSYGAQPTYYAAGQEYGSAYERKYRYSPPPNTRQSYSYPGVYADGYAYRSQGPTYAEYRSEPKTRERRSTSYAAYTQPAAPAEAGGYATDADARRAGIPAGFSLKHWDPNEVPILLLGSVFDANTLGKWIFDWTVACHGAGTPMAEVAGELWILLIKLASKIKRAESKYRRIVYKQDRVMVKEYLESGERLWSRLTKLLKVSESYMLKVAKKKSSSKKVVVGKDSGFQFIKCIFGRDHELDRTEKLMAGIRLWDMRFDANCEDILRST